MGCIMRGMRNSSIKNELASIGIGAMIVFIAMVLVAGIAASVIIQTSVKLESQSMSTGQGTLSEVSTGVAVYGVEAYAASGSDISKLAILVRPRAGTEEIDLSNCLLELSNTDKKVILNYTTSYYAEPDGQDDIFSVNVFPDDNYAYGNASNRDGTRFGLLVLNDADNSVSATHPVINRGDKVYICINATGCFNGIAERSDIWGMVIPEEGSPGAFEFRTPSTYADTVMELMWDL
ncbi:MAG: flagellin [Thermoplasmata archaeon]|nr:MAG: flagellin [Thermoplasmata archaeon]RLF30938.1 MAG: flagellin [Thermoplasmata archaeon]